MTTDEMSNVFDTLTAVFQGNYGFGQNDKVAFDEYEKSYFLSLAQDAFIISCYNGKNQSGYQFEVTEEDRRILDALVVTTHPDELEASTSIIQPIVSESVFYVLPANLMFITYEGVKFSDDDDSCIDGTYAAVYPVTQDEFWKTYKNPFRGANQRRVLRLDAGNNIVELVSKYAIGDYVVRYVKHPTPIVLEDMPEESDLSVFGETAATPCYLDEQVHNRIVEIAVNMALRTKSIGNK